MVRSTGRRVPCSAWLALTVDVDDAAFDAARAFLSPRQLVELVATVAYYNMVSRFLVGLKIDLET